jgi:hypothetical protein
MYSHINPMFFWGQLSTELQFKLEKCGMTS